MPKIKAKAQQIAPRPAISSYESEMFQIQKATAKAQKKLVDLESRKQDRESKEGKAFVSSKALEFKGKVKALEYHIKIVETRDDPEIWKNTEAETITRALKDQKLWDSSLSANEDVCREFERLVTIHGEPENAVETEYDFEAIKDLLKEL